jgi:hypothetical protein
MNIANRIVSLTALQTTAGQWMICVMRVRFTVRTGLHVWQFWQVLRRKLATSVALNGTVESLLWSLTPLWIGSLKSMFLIPSG